MSLKTLSKTRWETEPGRVTIYPYRIFYIMSAILAIFFALLLIIYIKYENSGINESLFLALFATLIIVLFGAFARTNIVFDNSARKMKKKLLGFLPVKTVAFDELHGINVVTQLGGGYNFRAFKKADRYGKGTIISSGYRKENDANATAFTQEVLPIIDEYLKQDHYQANPVAEPLTSYKFFSENAGTYTIKKNKVWSTLFGLALLALGIHELTGNAWMEFNSQFGRYAFMIALIVIGMGALLLAFTSIVFEPATQFIHRKSILGNNTYAFAYFAGFQTVRRSVNFIYSGTEIRMYFEQPGTAKQQVITVHTLRTSKQIERFMEETRSIMGLPAVG